jgi:hypothetical protein
MKKQKKKKLMFTDSEGASATTTSLGVRWEGEERDEKWRTDKKAEPTE